MTQRRSDSKTKQIIPYVRQSMDEEYAEPENGKMEPAPPLLEDLVKEYEYLYGLNPLRWDDPVRDMYALNVIQIYMRIPRYRIPTSMLDIGCGSGHTIEKFASLWSETKMHGIDLSSTAIEVAQKRIPNACFTVGSLESVSFREKFEVVTAIGVLEHFGQPVDALCKIRNLLSPGGIVYIEIPNCISYHSSNRVEGLRRLTTGSKQWEWHLFRDTWEDWIRSSGFSISLSLKGPRPSMQFIWILTQGKESTPFLSFLRIHGYEMFMLGKENLLKHIYQLRTVVGRFLEFAKLQRSE